MSNENAGKEGPCKGANWKNWVAEAWEPMNDRRNELGWGKGTEAKNFVKDFMET